MMGMCMDMCSQMLSAIKTTSALAVFATPELSCNTHLTNG